MSGINSDLPVGDHPALCQVARVGSILPLYVVEPELCPHLVQRWEICHEGAEESRLAAENVPCLPTPFHLAQEMGKGLG